MASTCSVAQTERMEAYSLTAPPTYRISNFSDDSHMQSPAALFTTKKTTPSKTLFDLPSELRNQIYSYIAQDLDYGWQFKSIRIASDHDSIFPLRHPWPREPWRIEWDDPTPTRLGILCSVSKQFAHEFRSVWLVSWTAFRLSLQWLYKGDPAHLSFHSLHAFLDTLGERNRKHIKEIHAIIPYPAAVSDQEFTELEDGIRLACDGWWHDGLAVSVHVRVAPGPWMSFGTFTAETGPASEEIKEKIAKFRQGQELAFREQRPPCVLPPSYTSTARLR